MSFTQLNQLSIAFKKLSGKTHTNSSFGASNESIGSNIQVGASTVFGDPIPLSPNGSLWSITSGVVEKVRFELSSLPTSQYQASVGGLSGTSIDDSGDGAPTLGAFSNGIHAYALKLTGSYQTNSTNPLAGNAPFTNGYFSSGSGGTLQIIPESFGGAYSAAVYESDGTTLIPPLDEVDYYLDPYAGVLFVQDYDSATTPTFVDVYIYIGQFVTDKIDQAGIFTQTGSFYATTNNIQITGSLNVSGGVTGSFTGSFSGDGSGLTGIVATGTSLQNALTSGEGISPFTYNNTTPIEVAVSGAAQLSNNAITKWNNTDGKFTNSSLSDNGTVISGSTSIQLTGANSILSGSFSGSFSGSGAGLINIPASAVTGLSTFQITTGSVSASVDIGNTSFLLKSGSTEFISVTNAGVVTIGSDLVVSNNLTVNGTTTTINTANLLIEDKFALFASGAIAPTDGGIIIQSDSTGTGFALGYSTASTRWSLQSGLSGTATSFGIPNAFVGTVETGSVSPISTPTYGGSDSGHGTVFVNKLAGDIWIYA